MAKYTTVKGKNGVRYMKNNRFVAKQDVPADIKIKLDVGMQKLDDAPVEKEPLTCIFCGMGTKITRFLNMQAIPICEEHYYSRNVGQTVQKWKELHPDEENDGERENQN